MNGITHILRPVFSVVFAVALVGTVSVFGQEDDYADESPARVARIKVLEGDADLKRIDSEDWEKASENLPLVEGDQLQTLEGTRLEIQFDNETYLRLDENSSLKFSILGDEGIALSLSRGTALLSVLSFDPDAGYLEIDAPQTTVAITKEGKYRIDAGDDLNRSVTVSVWDGGTARVYSLDSGFTLKNEQTASMNLEGTYAGKWEVARSIGSFDNFDRWSAERDDFINKSLAAAQYGKYYDSDIYGADDLNYYGSWQYNNDYGYIWSPYDSALASYSNWSPYRYGQWRWLPYFGWTWVNAEPWGWSTYHYGRWIFLNGRWFWTPYSYSSYYGGRRSWWRPAIVYVSYIGTRFCWYPLPYHYSYYNYNRRYRNNWRHYRRPRTNTGNQTNTPRTPSAANIARADKLRTPPLQRVPSTAVITANRDVFGSRKQGYDTAPPEVSREILKKEPTIIETPPILPTWKQVTANRTPDIIVRDPQKYEAKRDVKIGADERKSAEPLDKKLLEQKMFKNRPPLTNVPRVQVPSQPQTERSRTGVFDRSAPEKKPQPANTPPVYNPMPDARKEEKKVTPPIPAPPKREEKKVTPPVYSPRPTPTPTEKKTSPPVYSPRPTPTPTEKKTSPPVYVPPRRTTEPPKREEPRRTTPTPPQRTQPAPRPSAPSKPAPSKPSPPKSTPKTEDRAPKKPPLSESKSGR